LKYSYLGDTGVKVPEPDLGYFNLLFDEAEREMISPRDERHQSHPHRSIRQQAVRLRVEADQRVVEEVASVAAARGVPKAQV
jgi:hypothetical protein